MKRLMPSTLIAYLQTNPRVIRADLFALTLPTGTVVYVTDGQFSITVPSGTAGFPVSSPAVATTFHATEYGRWERGAITSEASFECKANTMALTCVPQPTTVYPGMTVGLLNAALNGLFDAAGVTVYTCYMPAGNYGNVSYGIETKFVGTITKIADINRNKVEFECSDPMFLMDMKVPSRLYQTNCPWSFCDANCTLNAANYTVAFTAETGSTQSLMTPTTAFTSIGSGCVAGYFTQGVVKCTAGANAGLSQTVALHDSSGNLEMMSPWLLPISAGDTFTVIKGCDKSQPTCSKTTTTAGVLTNNLINNGGFPFLPPPTSAL